MISRGLKIEAFLVVLKQELERMGAEAFALHESSPHWPADDAVRSRLEIATQLYSGPGKAITKKFQAAAEEAGLPFLNSWDISREQGIKRQAKRIDDTKAGQLLVGMNLEKYFKEVYGKDKSSVANAALQAWTFLSHEFVKATKKHLYTTIPGADANRVFCSTELPTALKEKRHTDINAEPWGKIAKIRGRARQARYAALTGIRLAWLEARTECAKNSPHAAQAVMFYQVMLAYYRLGQRNKARLAKKKIAPVYKPSAKDHVERILRETQSL